MVAAWMSAETGVGPSIASGSQTWSGNCALFPAAPAKMPSANKVMTVEESAPVIARCWISSIWKVPARVQMRSKAASRPRSPMRVTINAFLAAAAALGL